MREERRVKELKEGCYEEKPNLQTNNNSLAKLRTQARLLKKLLFARYYLCIDLYL